ncbi:MJ0042-type zinc finger domain-containing protein [Massilia sp. MB5]|uniref:MJ0042-type zinc finger domain-containing protein n=1 Tax=Massilia sp. MB5 TaxID=2919578 RepID=UPI0027D984A3|nr:MJ0042-type zinc finger domain-containing protein [Massilia sp. MB5]
MALATKCPHCNTVFRVAHDQLKLRGGIVRCGACNEVFDGNAALLEPSIRPPILPLPLPCPPQSRPSRRSNCKPNR